jgi:hypothetical protein
MKLPRRKFLHLAAGTAALPVFSRFARAQVYPTRQITIIVPAAAGGTTDEWLLLGQWGGGLGGIEGRYYVGNTTLYGQAGYGGQFNNGNCGTLDRYWFLRGVVRHFITRNWMVNGEVSFADGKSQRLDPPEFGLTILTWGVGTEYRMDGSRFSVFARFYQDHLEGAQSGIPTVTQNTFLVGGKINFGAATLFDDDRRGSTFDLPAFHRALHWGCQAQC